MKTKYLKAIILDQDPSQTKLMCTLIKDLFSQVHTSSSLEELKKECSDLKARVIFINLTLNQRISNFELIENLDLNPNTQTIMFGYTETHEPELIAHAIEEGLSDIFVKPFDADIVATKINRFFIFEKTQAREIGYSPLGTPLQGKLHIPLKIVGVDENGFEIKSNHYISKGASFRITDPLIKEVFEDHSIELMVTKTWMADQYGEFFSYAEPKMSGEKTSAALRRFILRKV